MAPASRPPHSEARSRTTPPSSVRWPPRGLRGPGRWPPPAGRAQPPWIRQPAQRRRPRPPHNRTANPPRCTYSSGTSTRDGGSGGRPKCASASAASPSLASRAASSSGTPPADPGSTITPGHGPSPSGVTSAATRPLSRTATVESTIVGRSSSRPAAVRRGWRPLEEGVQRRHHDHLAGGRGVDRVHMAVAGAERPEATGREQVRQISFA